MSDVVSGYKAEQKYGDLRGLFSVCEALVVSFIGRPYALAD